MTYPTSVLLASGGVAPEMIRTRGPPGPR